MSYLYFGNQEQEEGKNINMEKELQNAKRFEQAQNKINE
jgi:hypothetical protein